MLGFWWPWFAKNCRNLEFCPTLFCQGYGADLIRRILQSLGWRERQAGPSVWSGPASVSRRSNMWGLTTSTAPSLESYGVIWFDFDWYWFNIDECSWHLLNFFGRHHRHAAAHAHLHISFGTGAPQVRVRGECATCWSQQWNGAMEKQIETGTSCRGFTLFVVSAKLWCCNGLQRRKQFLDSQRTTWEIHDSFRSFCILGLFSSTILPDCILYHRCMCLHLLLNPRDTAVPFPWLNWFPKTCFSVVLLWSCLWHLRVSGCWMSTSATWGRKLFKDEVSGPGNSGLIAWLRMKLWLEIRGLGQVEHIWKSKPATELSSETMQPERIPCPWWPQMPSLSSCRSFRSGSWEAQWFERLRFAGWSSLRYPKMIHMYSYFSTFMVISPVVLEVWIGLKCLYMIVRALTISDSWNCNDYRPQAWLGRYSHSSRSPNTHTSKTVAV